MPDWDASDIVAWKEEVRKEQQFYCERLGDRDYDLHTREQGMYVQLKIAYSLFAYPEKVDEKKEEVCMADYNKEQQNSTKAIYETLTNNSGTTLKIAFIFLFVKQHDKKYKLPIIRFESGEKMELFMDHYRRIYSSWSDFMEWNELPKCLYCYPINGCYRRNDNDLVDLGFTTSPRFNIGEQAVELADKAATVTNIGLTGLFFVGLVTPIAPVILTLSMTAGAVSSVYTVGRSSTKLYDRNAHRQSISLNDSESRGHWLGVAGGILNVATLGTAKYITNLAVEGEVASKVMRSTFNYINTSNLAVNGISIWSNICDLSEKEKVSPSDVANLTLSILFFCNSAVKYQTARKIIMDTQKNVLKNAQKSVNSDAGKKGFSAYAKQNRKEARSSMYGNAKTIKAMGIITDPQGFCEGFQLARTGAQKIDPKGKIIKVRINNDLLISFNDELKIHPYKWSSIDNKQIGKKLGHRAQLLECVKKIEENLSNDAAMIHIKDVKQVCRNEKIVFERTRKATIDNLTKLYEVSKVDSIEVNGVKLFDNMRPFEIDRIGNVISNKGRNVDQRFIECVTLLCEKTGCKSVGEFCSVLEFTYTYIRNERNKFPIKSKPSIPSIVNDLLSTKNSDTGAMKDLHCTFLQHKSMISKSNQSSPRFATEFHAAYHFYKHKNLGPKGEVTSDQYFQIIKEITSRNDIKTEMLSQEGDKRIFTFLDKVNEILCVTIEPLVSFCNSDVLCATLYHKPNKAK